MSARRRRITACREIRMRGLGACPSHGPDRVASAAGPDARKRDPGHYSGRLLGAAFGVLWCACAAGGPEPPPSAAGPEPEASAEFRNRLERGIELFRGGVPHAAEAELLRAAALAPADPRPHLFLGRNFSSRNFLTRAEAEFRRALELDPGSIEARVGLLLTFERKGQSDSALEVVREILEIDPDHPDGLYYRGRFASRRGDFAAAAADLERAGRSRPEDPEIRYQHGLVLLKQGRPDAAAAALREALRLEPRHLGALQGLARALRAVGEDAGAEAVDAEFQQVREARERDQSLLGARDRAVEAFNAGNLDLALTEFRRIVAVRPADGQAITYLGSTHLARGERAEARRYLQRGVEIDPDNEFAWMELGRLAALEGDLGRAEELLRRAAQINPDFPLPRYFLAGIYRNQDRIPESDREMAEFLRLRDLAAGSAGKRQDREYW